MGDSRYDLTDFVVFLPGIMGSTLHQNGEPVWEPSAGALLRAIGSLGRSLQRLRLPDGVGDSCPDDGVVPVAVMPDLHVVPGLWTAHVGYSKLLNWLESTFGLVRVTASGPPGNLLPVPYDWRLSNRYNGRLLKSLVEPALSRWRERGGRFAGARVVFICHSMGGLVARWYIQREGGASLTRKLITLGTPHRGALNALEQLVNGVRKGPRPFRLDLTGFARSLPSIHQLLPEYACLESSDGGLRKTTELPLPEVSTAMVADAMAFHTELDGSVGRLWESAYDLHLVLGQKQTTPTTARLAGGVVEPLPTIEGVNEYGDSTVPALSAIPSGLRPSSPIIRYVSERHGSLQSNQSLFDELEGILTATAVIHRAPNETPIDVRVDDVLDVGEPLIVEATFPGGEPEPLVAELFDATHRPVDRPWRLTRDGLAFRASLDPPAPGAYELEVRGFGSARTRVTPVTAPVFVWEPQP